jgi:hypothetical protein
MGKQQPIRVVVEKKPSGCWGVFGVMLLIGLAIEYWNVSLGILALLVAIAAVAHSKQTKEQALAQEKARHRPGPRDPWLNEVAVALADLGLVERARNTGAQVGGVPIDGDIGLDADRLSMFVTLFATDAFARQAELALRAKPEVRAAESNGQSATKAQGRVLYTANGRGGIVDEFRFDDVVRVVDKISLPPPLRRTSAPTVTSDRQAPRLGGGLYVDEVWAAEPDTLEQLRKLAELHAAGVLTEEEFGAKKAELLRRV